MDLAPPPRLDHGIQGRHYWLGVEPRFLTSRNNRLIVFKAFCVSEHKKENDNPEVSLLCGAVWTGPPMGDDCRFVGAKRGRSPHV
jgi:hypothetical protein